MRLRPGICCLGIIICLCSCKEEVISSIESNVSTKFSSSQNQSLSESKKEFNKFQSYMEKGREKAITNYNYDYLNPVTGETQTISGSSIDHNLLSDHSEYVYEEDVSTSNFRPDDYNNQKTITTYLYEKSNNNYLIRSSQESGGITYFGAEYVIKNGKLSQFSSGGHTTTYDSDYVMNDLDIDRCVADIGLAERLLTRIRYYFLDIFSGEDDFSAVEYACTKMYFKVKNRKAEVKLCYNVLFRNYNEETGGANLIMGGHGYKEERDGPLQEGWLVGKATQEFKFSNYLLYYNTLTYELNGRTDSKTVFKKV